MPYYIEVSKVFSLHQDRSFEGGREKEKKKVKLTSMSYIGTADK
jgi:hypothetical protein